MNWIPPRINILDTLSNHVSTMLLLSFLLALILSCWSRILKLLGHEIHISSVSLFPLTLRDITYHYRASNLSLDARIGSVKVFLHIPTPWNPKLLSVAVENATYNKGDLHAFKCAETSMVIWFLPVFFRRASSSFVTVRLKGTVIDNANVGQEAWWVNAIRENITTTIMQGETIRLEDLKTKLWLYEPIAPTMQASKVDVEGQNLGEVDEDEPGEPDLVKTAEEDEEEGGILDNDAVRAREQASEDEREVRARVHAVHWMVHNSRNHRIYSFGVLDVELRRPWGSAPYPAKPDRVGIDEKVNLPSGSLVLKATAATWTKLPRSQKDDEYFKASTPIKLLRSIKSFPSLIIRTLKDPMSVVDIESEDAKITYREFQLRDADILKHAFATARMTYNGMEPTSKQAISDWGWAMFCDGVERALSND